MIFPVSGRKPCVGSSVVIRHWQRRATQMQGSLLLQAEVGEGLTGSDAHLALHEVDIGDLLGDRVFHRDARVHPR